MKQGTEEWFVAMANGIKMREHAEAGVARWKEKLAEAEQQIQALANGATTETDTVTAQEPSTEQE